MKLIIENLSKAFGVNKVLSNITFRFDQGLIYALLGRNGSGKTTLFSLIADEVKKDQGSVWLEDTAGVRRPLKSEDLFFMVANPALPNFLTGYEFIEFFLDVNCPQGNHRSPDEYMDWIGFEEADKRRLIQGYSLGMKNKLQMLMFLILEPAVILMDEPLTSLDVIMQLRIKNLIRQIHSDHIILFSTHILQLATDLCDEIVILSNGGLTQVDHALLTDPAFEERVIDILSLESDPADPELAGLLQGSAPLEHGDI